MHYRSNTQNDSLAQQVEHIPFKDGVLGSNPRRITEQIGKMPQIAETKTVSAIFVIPLSGRIVNIVRYGGVQFVNSLRLSRNLVGINFRHPNVMPNFAVWETITYRQMGIRLRNNIRRF